MPDMSVVIAIIALALAFDFINGFHDAANSIATVVSTRVLSPRWAVFWAAFFNFIAFLVFDTKVANTIGKGTVDPDAATLSVVTAGLIGAIVWNLITWWFGLPSSSTHALIGGLVGAGLAGGMAVYWSAIVDKVVLPMIISPLVGFGLAFAVMVGVMWLFRYAAPAKTNRRFRIAQTASAAAMALGHGLQDAQKTMGVIYLALLTVGWANADQGIPLWVKLSAAAAISAGTYSGGWRIMRTLGRRIIELDPPQGFAAETTAASVMYTASFMFHAPISTTHVITSAIMGVGSTKRLSAVRWGVAKNIIVGWFITMPMAAVVAALCYGAVWLAFA